MKIDDIRTRWLRLPLSPPIADATHVLEYLDLIVVEIHSVGIWGVSYMLSFDYAPVLLKGIVDHELRRRLIGMPADDIRAVYEQARAATEYIGPEGLASWGIAAIDTALWDLLARRLNIPVSMLFGRHARQVPVYGSGGWLNYSDEQLADEVTRYVARGFAGVKIKIGARSEDRDIERVQAVRQAIGADRILMVDANQGLTIDRARRFARRMEDCRLTWFEEPFPKQDLESYVRLAAFTEIPLAAGEREYGVAPFRRLMEAGAVDVVQPDLMRAGGVTAWRGIAELSGAFQRRLAPHFYKEYDVHLAAAVPNLVAIESFDWLDPLIEHPLEVADGMATVPERPGFGVEFRPEAIQEFEVRDA
jgi:L-alanine-DL-glutamate epimerase-like enolase superfamily enzyme